MIGILKPTGKIKAGHEKGCEHRRDNPNNQSKGKTFNGAGIKIEEDQGGNDGCDI